jgi:hypothetical protein
MGWVIAAAIVGAAVVAFVVYRMRSRPTSAVKAMRHSLPR